MFKLTNLQRTFVTSERPSESPDFDDIFDDFEEEDQVIFGTEDEGEELEELDEQDEQDGVEYLADGDIDGCDFMENFGIVKLIQFGPTKKQFGPTKKLYFWAHLKQL